MEKKNIVVWGAGKIGRGFIAELFFSENYKVIFIDQSESLIDQINKKKIYHVILARSKDDISEVAINGFDAFTTSQTNEIQQRINQSNILAIAVFPKQYEEVALQLKKYLLVRRQEIRNSPLNILLCTNLIHAGPIFREYLFQDLTKEEKEYFDQNIGIVESLVIRICPEPDEVTLKKDPLAVLTNGYPELPVDSGAFKGQIPAIKSLRLVKDMRAEEIRKIYTYNMCHAVLSYLGNLKGHKLLVECLADDEIKNVALGALQEISSALQKEYSFTPSEMVSWINGVIDQTNNPAVGDTVFRSAADPIRKLNKDDRLIGPSLLCIRNGITPTNIIYAIGAALNFYDDNDNASKKLHELINQEGLRPTIQQVCGLSKEHDDLIDEIIRSYLKILLKFRGSEIAQKAYQLGFEYEKIYHGCGQCALAAILEATDLFDEEVFRTATGLSGGVGQVTDATCAAFIGGAMAIGLFFGRRRKYFNADRADKYKNFELVQHLRERFINEYGTITCKEIHRFKYGRTFDLTNKTEAELFEKAGAHGDKGETEVVANAAKWTIEVLMDEFNQD